MEYIPYARQHIEEDDIEAVARVLRSDFLTTGPEIEKFEQDFSAYVGAKYAVAVSNGTAALHCACLAAGIGRGDEVITTPVTFAASANAVLYCGGRPIFADIDSQTYNIDPKRVEEKITEQTKAIIPVHFTGQPCDMDPILQLANKYKLCVIEDAAHGLGATYKGRKIGSIGRMTIFSFHPVKHITTGEGGIITTDDPDLYERLCLFRSHGITRDADKLLKNEGGWYYEQQALGYNYRLTDIQAALGRSQLSKNPRFLQRRKEIAALYNAGLKDITGITLPCQMENGNSSWHLYIIRCQNRAQVFNALRKANIGVNVHYIPVYRHPYYQQLGYKEGLCPEGELFYKEAISLPMYYELTDSMVERVIWEVRRIVQELAE